MRLTLGFGPALLTTVVKGESSMIEDNAPNFVAPHIYAL